MSTIVDFLDDFPGFLFEWTLMDCLFSEIDGLYGKNSFRFQSTIRESDLSRNDFLSYLDFETPGLWELFLDYFGRLNHLLTYFLIDCQ
jgi:hypothetical protein